MAYNGAGISGPFYAGGALGAKRLWFYDTLDALATVTASNYFNDPNAPRGFQPGDVMFYTQWSTAVGAGGTIANFYILYCTGVVATSAYYPAELNSSYDGAATFAQWSNATGITNNFSATSDPTVSNDTSQGYTPGSMWLNTTTGEMWRCVSNGSGAAVWEALDSVDYNFRSISLASAANAISFVPGFKFRLHSFTAVIDALTTSPLSTAVTAQAKDGSTNITGGLITFTTSDVVGTARSAITSGDQPFANTDTLNIAIGTPAAAGSTADFLIKLKKIG